MSFLRISSLSFLAMVLPLAVPAAAHAESECNPLEILAIQPPDDGGALPAGSTVRVFYDDGLCHELAATLTCGGGASSPATTTAGVDLTLVELEVGADVATGATCELVVTEQESEVARRTFTVGDEQPAALAAPKVAGGRLEQLSGDGAGPSRYGNAVVEAAPDPLGMSKIAVFSDAFGLCGIAPAPPDGGRVDVQLDCAAPTGGDACVRVDQIDALGRVTSSEGCLETFTAEEDDDAASGCSAGASGDVRGTAPFAVGVAAVALVAARRRRRAS